MDSSVINLNKEKEKGILLTKSEQLANELADKSGMKGFDAYMEGETKNRLTRSIERLSKHTTLSDAELESLKNSVTEEPVFGHQGEEFEKLLKPEQTQNFGLLKKKRYNKKEKAYKKNLSEWEKENLDKLYEQENKVKDRVKQDEVKEAKRQEAIKRRAKFYPDSISNDPEEIDRLFIDNGANAEFMDHESKSEAINDMGKISRERINAELVAYSGHEYNTYNNYLRGIDTNISKPKIRSIEMLKAGLSKCKIDRNMIVRRGVKGLGTLANMLGLKADSVNADKLKDAVKKHISDQNGKDVILTDPAFISTSFDPAGTYLPDAGSDGVEFIIKVNKGTSAANIMNASYYANEKEILLNAGTKFRLLKVYYNGCDGEEQRPLSNDQLNGKKEYQQKGQHVWKVYLETIPSKEEGELK